MTFIISILYLCHFVASMGAAMLIFGIFWHRNSKIVRQNAKNLYSQSHII